MGAARTSSIMKKLFFPLSIAAVMALVPFCEAAVTTHSQNASDTQQFSLHTLWYQHPAKDWQMEALPIGNGKLGAMVFGKVAREQFMFNEDSLWIGDENDTGSYQTFGNIFVNLHPEPFRLEASTPCKWQNDGEDITQAFSSASIASGGKWCFEHHGEPIVADISVIGKSTPLTEYTITSANDAPDRDPANWKLLGSKDGKTWKTLDEQKNVPHWKQRGEKKTFHIDNKTAYSHYRFVFQPRRVSTGRSNEHLQLILESLATLIRT